MMNLSIKNMNKIYLSNLRFSSSNLKCLINGTRTSIYSFKKSFLYNKPEDIEEFGKNIRKL